MANTSTSLLLHPQLHSFARAYMWQLLRQGTFAEKASEPLHVLAQELAQAIAATSGDREQKNRLLSALAQHLAAGDLSRTPPPELQALLRPFLPNPEAPEAPEAPAPASPATPQAPEAPDAPAAPAAPAAPEALDASASSAAASAPAADQPPVAPPAPVASETQAAEPPAAVASPTAPTLDPSAAVAASAHAAPAHPESVVIVGASADAAATSSQHDATVEFVVSSLGSSPSTTTEPASADAPPTEAELALPPPDPSVDEGAPGVSTDVKPKGNRKNRKS